MNARKELLLSVVCIFCLFRFSSLVAETVSSFAKETDGALCRIAGGTATTLKLQVCAANIIRVIYTSEATIPAPQGLAVSRTSFAPGTWDAVDDGTAIVVTTPKVKATVNKADGSLSFANAAGTVVCSEIVGGRTLVPVTKGAQAGFSGTLQFDSPPDEAVYGLGNLSFSSPPPWSTGASYWENFPPDRNGILDIRGLNVDMHQANFYDVIPFFMTTRGYGILMNFCCHAVKTSPLDFTADFLLNDSWDYFFVYGPQFDTIISGYRNLTGGAPMLPKWVFGYWQSKNAYTSAAQLAGVVDTFRSKAIPIDCIVQDWFWWTGGTSGRGSFTWESTRYPDPAGMLTTIHNKNCHFAISIWPTFSSGTANYTAMQSHLITGISCSGTTEIPGVFMNVFDTTGMRLFWGYISASCWNKGIDAWWTDATEPECNILTAINTIGGVIDQYANAYTLALAKNIYERQRTASTAKRVVNLTRSFYAGQQRFGAIYSNGDVGSDDMKNVATTVAGGINSCMAGNPYWCSDIGGWNETVTDEILIRWFQAGTFFPIFRTHGTRATELYNFSAAAQTICLEFSKLRYRLMPYVYSLAWKVTSEHYTMTRALPFDFPDDPRVRNIADQFMFGPALLVDPVTESGAVSRKVYLPDALWYDFWTGDSMRGATTIEKAAAPLSTIPLYCRAGSILPMGPDIQYATQSADPIELRVYPGADGSFILYEDENDGYNYEHGTYATIPLTWNNSSRTLTIGDRSGAFPNMPAARTFNVVIVARSHGAGGTVTTAPDASVPYFGSTVSVRDGRIGARPRNVSSDKGLGAFSIPMGIPHPPGIEFVIRGKAAGKRVTIKIFDCKGSLVVTPLDRPVSTGAHVVTIDRKKLHGAGMYFCTLVGTGFGTTRAFVVTN